jgi:hypothetical protein
LLEASSDWRNMAPAFLDVIVRAGGGALPMAEIVPGDNDATQGQED